MKGVLFHIFYGVNWLLTLLLLRVLYLFSDLTYVILYHLAGYRRKVVATNLANSFPNKSVQELKQIEKDFYRHLCDLFVEVMKSVHLGKKEFMARMRMENPELLHKFFEAQKDGLVMMGHFANWEWLTAIPLYSTNHKLVSIYKQLKNRHFDKFMVDLRSSTGATLVPTSAVLKEILNNRREKKSALYLSIADQTPPRGEIRFWTTFMEQDTPFYTGTGKLAVKYGIPVFFLWIDKVKRGYYTFTVEPLVSPGETGFTEEGITEAYARRLEELIKNRPELYLWSHRRWKHKRTE